MPAHLDRDVPPLGIPDVERIVIDERHRVLAVDIANFPGFGVLHFPHRRPCFGHQNQEHSRPPIVFGQISLCGQELLLLGRAIYQRYASVLGEGPYPASETSGHAHQVGRIQIHIRAVQGTPPDAHAAGILPHPKVGVQHDAVHAVVAILDQVVVMFGEFIHAVHQKPITSRSRLPPGAGLCSRVRLRSWRLGVLARN